MKVLLIEDENAAVRRLEKMLKEADPDIDIAGVTDSVESSVEWLGSKPTPDLIFMDIHLADGSSFEIFEYMKVEAPVVFTTAYDEYALRAFKVNALDYLMKPLKPAELQATLARFKATQAATPDYGALLNKPTTPETPALRRILVRLGQSIRLVEVSDVAYFYTRDKITFLVTQSTGKRFPVDNPLDKLEGLLDKNTFYRINRQFIVNINAIKEMHPYSKSRIKIDLEPAVDLEIIVSSERASDFKAWLVGGE